LPVKSRLLILPAKITGLPISFIFKRGAIFYQIYRQPDRRFQIFFSARTRLSYARRESRPFLKAAAS